MHLRRRFAVRRHLEFEFHAVDGSDVTGRDDEISRAQQRDRARRHGLAEPAIDLPARALRQQRPELVHRAAQHRRTGDDVFGDRVLHEQIGRDDRHLAAGERCVVEHAARTAPMVGMGMGEDHGADRPLAAVLEVKLHRGPRALDRGQRVHHDHAALALDQRHVGDVEAAHLVDAGHHLEQAMMHVEPRLPPQAGIDGRRRLFGRQEAVGLEAPDRPALRRGDLGVFHRAEKAARGVVEIPDVGERQRLQRRRMLRDDGGGRFLRGFLGGFRRGWLAHCCVLPCANKNRNDVSGTAAPRTGRCCASRRYI